MASPSKVWTIVVGGGSGTRFGRPKQYERLGDERIIDRSRRIAASATDGVVLVVPADDAATEGGVAGGSSRSESVRAGLAEVPPDTDIVCVHDAARPFADADLYRRVVAAIEAGADASVPGIAVTDTIKIVDGDGVVTATPDRSTLVAVQTPQAFRHAALVAAHASGADATDDAALIEATGGRVVVVEGAADNRKITVPDDLDWARQRIVELDRLHDSRQEETS
ncbi:MAG: 2-C-methyl-D-erythritol 4-phosphate cytidylyltransferase [Ilumatobacter fluminis]|uniref:2-C-methyl-D-erythritol 4-phosphate cytidylyltransferase n=1 Tax=Ilumatobacter fluminis TaxID=467091 RepID=UPI0032F00B69